MTSIAERINDEAHHQRETPVHPNLSFDAALRFLRRSRTAVEARRAGEILRQSVIAERTENGGSDSGGDVPEVERVHELVDLLRHARSPYEVRVASEALRQAVRSVTFTPAQPA